MAGARAGAAEHGPEGAAPQQTGELVERGAYQPYGGAESDYRPERWGAFREDYRFTGKEEDVEVGLTYFGKRYLSAALGRWASADPLTVHGLGKADANVYAYVRGAILTSTDPTGLEDISWGDVAKRAMLALCPIYSAYEEAKAGNYAMAVARAVPGTNLLLAKNVEGPLGTVEVAKAGYACASGTCGAPEKETLASAAVVAIVSGGLMKALPEGGGVGLIKPRPARVRPPLTKAQRIAELNAIRDDTIASLKGEPAEAAPELSVREGEAPGAPPGAATQLPAFSQTSIESAVAQLAEPFNSDLSVGARELSKKLGHARAGGYRSAFEGVAPTTEGAQGVMQEIMSSPAKITFGKKTYDVYDANGRGARFDMQGNFKGFLEGSRASR